jgi:acyl carrier protein
MKREEIVSIVNDFLINEIEIDESLVKTNALLKQDLDIDSLDFVDIVVIVERNFGFKIKAEEMANIKTLDEFYDYIEKKVNQQ